MRTSATALFLALAAIAGCGSSTAGDTPDAGGDDSGGGGDDDGGGGGLPCSPGARACFGDVVGICNSTGTGWLFEESCADTCAAGACTGACVPGAKRCNAGSVETCAADASWSVTEACAHGCDSNQCVLDQLDVTTDTDLGGLVIVDGAVNVFAGATLHVPSGDLTIRAASITVDPGGAIDVAPVGEGTDGRGGPAAECYSQHITSNSGGGGGGHATRGGDGRTIGGSCGGLGGAEFGSPDDLSAEPGGPGGPSYGASDAAPGGGVLRLFAPAITIGGTLRADGGTGDGYGQYPQYEAGGGAGGSIVIAADQLSLSGPVSAGGGGGGSGGGGGGGYLKILHGATAPAAGMRRGLVSDSLAPPLAISSVTHPDPALFYNDDFTTATLAWERPFAAPQGYYWHADTSPVAPPTAGAGTLALTETLDIPRAQLVAGDNYVHLVSVSATSAIGTVESTFRLRINADPPALASETHPDPTAWSENHDPLVAWTFPQGDASYRGVYYVLDHYGTTIPDAAATFVPVTQHQLLRAGLASGIWVLHVISVDRAGHRTRAAAHYQLRLGADPGTGRVLGHVSGPAGALANATVTFNRGVLADQHTNSGGTYDLATVPAGTWEVTASAPGFAAATQTVTVAAAGQATVDFTLAP